GKGYVSNKQVLPPVLANMTPLQFNAIRYDPNHSLWKDVNGQLDVHFFHVGMGFKTPVRMYSVDPQNKQAREVHFRHDLFNYESSGIDKNLVKG
ncbi:glucan biosynthesis protein, partial [Pseudomonas viridiflava]